MNYIKLKHWLSAHRLPLFFILLPIWTLDSNRACLPLPATACRLVSSTSCVSTLCPSSSSPACCCLPDTACYLQAGANIVCAHIVSIVFLTLIVKKITSSTRKIVEWADQMRASLGQAL